jgi:DNA-binding transcriptional ArsR family regulator
MHSIEVLADATRRQVMEMLAGGEMRSGDIARRIGVTAPAVSQHLRVMREAGLVSVRIDAQRRYYRIDTAGLDEIEAWVGKLKRFWNGRLDRLESALAHGGAVKGSQRKTRRRRK